MLRLGKGPIVMESIKGLLCQTKHAVVASWAQAHGRIPRTQ